MPYSVMLDAGHGGCKWSKKNVLLLSAQHNIIEMRKILFFERGL